MKKIYNQPVCLVVEFGTIHMMAESLPIGGGGSGSTIEDPDDILVKASTTTDINVWDKEW
ncbi:MAG: hypothetical protein J6V92_09970 [Bacteroidaceae bacterium]|nr:hypothetical protein [Bacteroidaceae bacterium]